MPALLPHRINLIGASGSGKTTLGQALAQELDYPVFDADTYYHVPTDPPFQKQRPPAERLHLLTQDLSTLRQWVISGSLISFGTHPKLDFSLIVFLWLPPDLRIERLRQRERERYGTRLDPDGDMHQNHQWFMTWTSGYDTGTAEINNLQIHKDWLARQTCPILSLTEPLSTQAQLELILKHLKKA